MAGKARDGHRHVAVACCQVSAGWDSALQPTPGEKKTANQRIALGPPRAQTDRQTDRHTHTHSHTHTHTQPAFLGRSSEDGTIKRRVRIKTVGSRLDYQSTPCSVLSLHASDIIIADSGQGVIILEMCCDSGSTYFSMPVFLLT